MKDHRGSRFVLALALLAAVGWFGPWSRGTRIDRDDLAAISTAPPPADPPRARRSGSDDELTLPTPAPARSVLGDSGDQPPEQHSKLDVDESEQPGTVSVTGIVTLADGTPLGGLTLHALDSREPERGFRTYEARFAPDLLLGTAITNAAGEFTMEVRSRASSPRQFRLQERLPCALGSNRRVYDLTDPQPLHHVLPGTILPVRVIGQDGYPMIGAVVRAYVRHPSATFGSAVHQLIAESNEDGRVEFRTDLTGTVSLMAMNADGTQSTELRELPLPGGRTEPEAVLALSTLAPTGRIRVTVRSREGLPVDVFAVRIQERSDDGVFNRYLTSEELPADPVIDRIPLGEMTVRLERRFTPPIHLYSTTDVPPAELTLEDTRIVPVDFVVDLSSRIVFALERVAPDASPLVVRCRHTDSDSDEWSERFSFWQYDSEKATSTSTMLASGRYHSDELRPGTIDLEISETRTKALVWRGQLELPPGELIELELQL